MILSLMAQNANQKAFGFFSLLGYKWLRPSAVQSREGLVGPKGVLSTATVEPGGAAMHTAVPYVYSMS